VDFVECRSPLLVALPTFSQKVVDFPGAERRPLQQFCGVGIRNTRARVATVWARAATAGAGNITVAGRVLGVVPTLTVVYHLHTLHYIRVI